VFARCIVGDKDNGVHPFLVQVRDVTTFKHKTGVTSGDMGAKFGYHVKDNGWARFEHVRIPRTDMLMGFAEVSKEGSFLLKGDMRALY
jgi:acyl-CoA oxidase